MDAVSQWPLRDNVGKPGRLKSLLIALGIAGVVASVGTPSTADAADAPRRPKSSSSSATTWASPTWAPSAARSGRRTRFAGQEGVRYSNFYTHATCSRRDRSC